MKKLLVLSLLAFALIAPPKAEARAGQYDVEYATMVPMGVICTTGTVLRWNLAIPFSTSTYQVAGYRLQNQDTADTLWSGGVSVSTAGAEGTMDATALANLGLQLEAGVSGWSPIGFKLHRSDKDVEPQYCKAADSAGANGSLLLIEVWGY